MSGHILKSTESTKTLWSTQPPKTHLERLEHSVFAGMATLFTPEVPRMGIYSNKFAFLVAELFHAFQIVTLFSSGTALADWDTYGWPWTVLYYSRVDYIAYKLGVLPVFLWVAPSAVVVLLLLFILHCALLPRAVRLLVKVTRIAFELQCKFLFNCVALQCATVVYLALSSTASGTIQGVQREDYQVTVGLAVLSAMALAVLVALKYVFIYGSTEVAHSRASRQFCAKAHSKLDRGLHLCQVTAILYCAIKGQEYPQYTSGIVAVGYSVLCLKQITWRPLYNEFVNQACVIVYSSTAAVAAAFVAGHASGQALVVLLFALCIAPCVVYFALQFNHKERLRIEALPIEALCQIRECMDFEVALRPHLLQKSELVQPQFVIFEQQCVSRTRTTLMLAWETFFLMYSRQDLSLARVKLTRQKRRKSSIEGNYQVFRCSQELAAYQQAGFDESQFLKYMLDISKVRERDRSLSLLILEFLDISESPDFCKLEKVTQMIHSQLETVENIYEHIYRTYGPTEQLMLLMSTYYSCVRTDEAKAAVLVQSFDVISNNILSNRETISSFACQNCLIIVSMDCDSPGRIIYLNQNAEHFLGYHSHQLLGGSFISIVPHLLKPVFRTLLERFFRYSSSSVHEFPETLFVENNNGNLEEVYISVQVVANDGNAFLMVILKEVDYCHALLLDKAQRVSAISAQLARLLGPVDIRGVSLKELSNVTIDQLTAEPMPVSLHAVQGYMVYLPKTFNKKTVHTTYIVPTHKEALGLCRRSGKVRLVRRHVLRKPVTHRLSDKPENLSERALRSVKRSLTLSKSIHPSFAKSMSEQRAVQLFVERSTRAHRLLKVSIVSAIGLSISYSVTFTTYLCFHTEISHYLDAFESIYALTVTVGKVANQARDGHSGADSIELEEVLFTLSDFINGEDLPLREFHYCNFFDSFSRTEIPVWTSESSSLTLTHMSFYQFLDSLLTHIQDFAGDNALNSQAFILANCLGAPYTHLRHATEQLYECQQTHQNQAQVILGVTVGALLVLVCTLFVGYAAWATWRSTVGSWLRLLNQFKKCSAQYNSAICERLKLLGFEDSSRFPKRSPQHSMQSSTRSFVWRLFVWNVLLLVFIVTIYYVLHRSFYHQLLTHTEIYSRIALDDTNKYELEYWFKEECSSTQFSQQLFAELNPFPPSSVALAQTLVTAKQERIYLATELAKNMRETELKYFFESCDTSPQIGCYSLGLLLEAEINLVLNCKCTDDFLHTLDYLHLLEKEEGKLLDEMIKMIAATENQYLRWIILGTATYIGLAILYFALVWVPFIKQLSERLQHRRTLVNLLPSVGCLVDSSI